MAEETAVIRDQIEQTRNHLTENLASLEAQVKQKVESARSSVNDTIRAVRSGMQHLSPTYQVREHPIWMMGGAVALGALTGMKLAHRLEGQTTAIARPPREREPGLFAEEFKGLKQAAIATFISSLGDMAQRAMPEYRDTVHKIFESMAQKMVSPR